MTLKGAHIIARQLEIDRRNHARINLARSQGDSVDVVGIIMNLEAELAWSSV